MSNRKIKNFLESCTNAELWALGDFEVCCLAGPGCFRFGREGANTRLGVYYDNTYFDIAVWGHYGSDTCYFRHPFDEHCFQADEIMWQQICKRLWWRGQGKTKNPHFSKCHA